MIDKDEYPQTAELKARCVRILADLWNAPDAATAIGCSTTGSSQAACWPGWRSSGDGATGRWPARHRGRTW